MGLVVWLRRWAGGLAERILAPKKCVSLSRWEIANAAIFLLAHRIIYRIALIVDYTSFINAVD